MSSLDRPLSGDVLVFDLEAEQKRALEAAHAQSHGPASRTLLKDGPLRITLIILGPGGDIPEHSTEGPITVQPIHGSISFTVAGQAHELRPGTVLSVGAGVKHSVRSQNGGAFLLTVALLNKA